MRRRVYGRAWVKRRVAQLNALVAAYYPGWSLDPRDMRSKAIKPTGAK